MSKYIELVGPNYQVIHSQFNYSVNILIYPDGFDESNTTKTFYFYKNDELVKSGSEYYLVLYDAEGPAEGVYRAEVKFENGNLVQIEKTNSIELTMGIDYKDLEVEIDMPNIVECNIGDNIKIEPIIICNDSYPNIMVSWKKGNDYISFEKDLNINASNSTAGLYEMYVYISATGAYNPYEQIHTLNIVLNNKERSVYLHDLNPGRNSGFAQVGYWITDEIQKANKNGIDWTNPDEIANFKYKDSISDIAAGLTEYDDIEIQESRNGKILHRSDLVVESAPTPI